MNRGINRPTREREILRAVASGANTVTAILPHSSYENISNVRTVCGELVRGGLLEKWMAIKSQPRNRLSVWSHGPRAAHYRLTAIGEARLAGLEVERAEVAHCSVS